jgi:hypothetical protein
MKFDKSFINKLDLFFKQHVYIVEVISLSIILISPSKLRSSHYLYDEKNIY